MIILCIYLEQNPKLWPDKAYQLNVESKTHGCNAEFSFCTNHYFQILSKRQK